MGKAPKEKPAGFWKGLFGAFTELPLQTKLAGFFQLAFIGVLFVLSPKLDGWQVIALSGILVAYFAFSVWIHRPDRAFPTAVPSNPLQPLLDADALRGLDKQPAILLPAVEAAVALLRKRVREVAKEVRGRPRSKSTLDVVKKLQGVLGLQKDEDVRSVMDILAWAERDS